MPHVFVEPVASYAQDDAIAAFVERAFEAGPAARVLSGAANPDRLVVVKPNWIEESHQHDADVWEPLITHPSLILATLECLAARMRGVGTIAVCDAPHTYADFAAIVARGELDRRLDAFRTRWPDLSLELIDLRREIWTTKDDVVTERHHNPHDPRGYVRSNLGRDSLFYDHPGEGRFYGADYDRSELERHHRGEVQEYLLAGTPMRCDLFVNLPKLKTHKKTGITCCLKNLVGINGDKNWLPHHTEGPPGEGGDEFPDNTVANSMERTLKRAGQKAALSLPVAGPWLLRQMRRAGKRVLGDSDTTIRNGNWYGNDTCWRMALDLNRALLYGNADGSWREAGGAKPYLAIVDGIVAGQGNGPIAPDPAAAGVLVAGTDPAVVDAVCTKLMGFDLADFPIVHNAFASHRWTIADTAPDAIRVADGRVDAQLPLDRIEPAVDGGFTPHFGWAALREKSVHGS